MKTKIILAAAALAGTVLIQYLRKRKSAANPPAAPAHSRTHHLTHVFAHAKEQASRL